MQGRTLVEKDYWIMHCLWGLKSQGSTFELKGGTSLSKGFGIIKRFSEDIDIRLPALPEQLLAVGESRCAIDRNDRRMH
jgi:predicted nucleotidyltransferase component of viral defense system